MKISSIKYIIPIIAIVFSLVGPFGSALVNASVVSPPTRDTMYTPLAPLPNLDTMQLQPSVDFRSYVTYAFNFLIAAGAVAAVFMITWGGFDYMTTDAVQGKKEGLTKIQNAIYGLLLILSSYLILRTIDPRFVNIPSTLVPQLTLNQTRYKITLYQAAMNDVSAQFQNQSDSAVNARNNARSIASDLQQQLTDAQSAEDAACDQTNINYISDANCQDSIANTNNIQDQLDTANANVAVADAVANTTGILNTVNSGGMVVNGINGSSTNTFLESSPAVTQAAQTAADKTAAVAIQEINANGAGNPTAIQDIQISHTVAIDGISIPQLYDQLGKGNAQVTPASIINQLNIISGTMNKEINTTSNTVLKEAAQTVIDSSNAMIGRIQTEYNIKPKSQSNQVAPAGIETSPTMYDNSPAN